MKQKIRGKIIRILNETTVVINLGQIQGITKDSVFGILGEPEIVEDPFSKEELGSVSLVKGRVKAVSVSEKFTIATSKWKDTFQNYKMLSSINQSLLSLGQSFSSLYDETVEEVNETLRVKQDEIKPWRALSEEFVQLGDEVEVTVDLSDEVDEEQDLSISKNQEDRQSPE